MADDLDGDLRDFLLANRAGRLTVRRVGAHYLAVLSRNNVTRATDLGMSPLLAVRQALDSWILSRSTPETPVGEREP